MRKFYEFFSDLYDAYGAITVILTGLAYVVGLFGILLSICALYTYL